MTKDWVWIVTDAQTEKVRKRYIEFVVIRFTNNRRDTCALVKTKYQ